MESDDKDVVLKSKIKCHSNHENAKQVYEC